MTSTVAALDQEALVANAKPSFGPWSSDHLLRLVVTNAVGFGLVLVGWLQAHGGGNSARTNLAWLNLVVLGLMVSGFANAMWLLRGHMVVGLAQVALLEPARMERAAPVIGAREESGLLASPATSRYHRPDCQLIAGKPRRQATRVDHEAEGLLPCEMCRP